MMHPCGWLITDATCADAKGIIRAARHIRLPVPRPFATASRLSTVHTSRSRAIHPDLLAAKALIYDPGQQVLTDFRADSESAAYGACTFRLNGASICFRVAKTTPRKVGQFVTLWKRIGTGPILPFDTADPFDFYVISARGAQRFGQFVFPMAVMRERGVLSNDGEGGKRAIRVYPPWDGAMSRQAVLTQRWQVPYFLEAPANSPMDHGRSQLLYAPRLRREGQTT